MLFITLNWNVNVIHQVEYSGGYCALNPHRFGQLFVNKVANTKDILLFFRKKASYSRGDYFRKILIISQNIVTFIIEKHP